MASRNAREGSTSTGITPQVHGDVLTDKLNREAAAEVEALKKKLAPVQPGEGEAPLALPRLYLRGSFVGWPYVTADLTINSGDPEATIPGSGMGLGTIYKGEQVHVEFFLYGLVSSGSVWTSTDLGGSAGQGSASMLQERHQPYLPSAGITGAARAWFTGAIIVAPGPIFDATLRFRMGSAGGSITVHNGDAMFQKVSIFTPINKASE
jgi:hypothetical protein